MSFLAWPLETNRIRRDVTNNTFGTVRRNADGTKRDHQGWDLVATPLTACYAIAEGVIRKSENHSPKEILQNFPRCLVGVSRRWQSHGHEAKQP